MLVPCKLLSKVSHLCEAGVIELSEIFKISDMQLRQIKLFSNSMIKESTTFQIFVPSLKHHSLILMTQNIFFYRDWWTFSLCIDLLTSHRKIPFQEIPSPLQGKCA